MKLHPVVEKKLNQYYEIKKNFELPLKVRLYFSTLESLMQANIQTQISKQKVVDQVLIKGFFQCSQIEKVSFLLQLMKETQIYYQQHSQTNQQKEERASQFQPTINNIETSCQLLGQSFKLSIWTHMKFRYDKFRRVVTLIGKKRNIILRLENYLIRNSKKYRYSIVFMSISPDVSKDLQKVCIYFKEEIYQKIYPQIFNSIVEIQKQLVVSLLKQNQTQAQQIRQTQIQSHQQQKNLQFLNSKQITYYLKYKKQIMERLKVGGFCFKNIYYKDNEGQKVSIDRSTKIDKLFKLQCILKEKASSVKQKFLDSINTKFRYKISCDTIEQFSKKYQAHYQKYLISNKIYEQLSITEQNNSAADEIYFMKRIQNIMISNNIQFCVAKVKVINDQMCKLIVAASIIINKEITEEVAKMYMVEFFEMIRRQDQAVQSDSLFFSIEDIEEEDLCELDDDEGIIETTKEIALQDLSTKSAHSHSLKTQVQSLSHKYAISPTNIRGRIMKEHFLFKEWKRCKNGGVVCVNEEMLKEQKQMIKKVIMSLGKEVPKIIKTGNVLNVSLPVTIFKKESHIQVIARNFSYAPLFFDKFEKGAEISAVERLKHSILFLLGANNLGIASQKPFNPILGQTLQCRIDGCPLYLQQITHHPANSSYLFVGRGYRIYGEIEAKIGMGLNTAKCNSPKRNFIEFDDGTKICFNYGRMVIKGLIFGDREFHFDDKTYCYDMTNHIFAQIHFGPQKKSFMSNSDPEDYVWGKIYKTTPEFAQKFNEKCPPCFPSKQHIISEISNISGIWNESIQFNNSEYFNFTKQFPFQLEYEKFQLPSSCTYRQDINELIKGNIEKSQQEKQKLEEIQRRDRKLREKGRKKK